MDEKRNFIVGLFGPNIIIVILYFFLLLALFGFYGAKWEFSHYKLWGILLSTLLVIYLSCTLWQHSRRDRAEPRPFIPFAAKMLLRFAIDWFPLVALVTIYENLREYTGVIRPDSIDAVLYKLDLFIFGVEPTIWIQKFTHPILTEYLAFTYSLYLVLPLSLAWLLYLLNKRHEFHTLATSLILCLCIGFLLYLIFPAGPPRFYLADLYEPKQLVGYFGYYNAMQTRFDAVNPMAYRASFPSLHVALSSLAVVHAIKFKKSIPFGAPICAIYTVLVASLWVATVYLRHHWVVDIFAGWALALACSVVAKYIQDRWKLRLSSSPFLGRLV